MSVWHIILKTLLCLLQPIGPLQLAITWLDSTMLESKLCSVG